MKRDMDLLREILLALEANASSARQVRVDRNINGDEFEHHCWLAADAGLIVSEPILRVLASTSIYKLADPICLTWAGHEVLAASRDPTRREQANKIAGDAKNWTFVNLSTILSEIARNQVMKALECPGLITSVQRRGDSAGDWVKDGRVPLLYGDFLETSPTATIPHWAKY